MCGVFRDEFVEEIAFPAFGALAAAVFAVKVSDKAVIDFFAEEGCRFRKRRGYLVVLVHVKIYAESVFHGFFVVGIGETHSAVRVFGDEIFYIRGKGVHSALGVYEKSARIGGVKHFSRVTARRRENYFVDTKVGLAAARDALYQNVAVFRFDDGFLFGVEHREIDALRARDTVKLFVRRARRAGACGS